MKLAEEWLTVQDMEKCLKIQTQTQTQIENKERRMLYFFSLTSGKQKRKIHPGPTRSRDILAYVRNSS